MAASVQYIKLNKTRSISKKIALDKKRLNLILLLGVIYIGVNFFNLVMQEMNLYNYKSVLDKQMLSVTQEHNNLKQNIFYFKTDAGIEEIARKNLGYVKNDEIPIKVIQSK